MIYYIRGTDGGDQVDPVFNPADPGLGVCIDYATVPNLSVNAFIVPNSSQLIPVDFESNRDAIITFYEEFESDLSQLTVIRNNIEQLIQEFLQAPPDQRLAIALQIVEQITDAIILLLTVYSQFTTAYYYGYNSSDQVQYWQINSPQAVALYVDSNLKRSYPAWTVTGNTVVDNFSDTLNCRCNCNSIIESQSNFWIFIVFFIIFFFFILLLVIIFLLI